MYWFQPWQLWVDETVLETLPSAAPAAQPPVPVSKSSAPAPQPVAPVEVATGTLISHEHRTTGTVRILRAADGSLLLRLDDLATSSGPDVHVRLTDAPVRPGKDGWDVFDDGKHLDAGKLKGNKGNQTGARPFDMTGRPMKGWLLVDPPGHEKDLRRRVGRGAAFARTFPPKQGRAAAARRGG